MNHILSREGWLQEKRLARGSVWPEVCRNAYMVIGLLLEVSQRQNPEDHLRFTVLASKPFTWWFDSVHFEAATSSTRSGFVPITLYALMSSVPPPRSATMNALLVWVTYSYWAHINCSHTHMYLHFRCALLSNRNANSPRPHWQIRLSISPLAYLVWVLHISPHSLAWFDGHLPIRLDVRWWKLHCRVVLEQYPLELDVYQEERIWRRIRDKRDSRRRLRWEI